MAHLKHYFCHLSENQQEKERDAKEPQDSCIHVYSNKWEIKATGGIVSAQVRSAGPRANYLG